MGTITVAVPVVIPVLLLLPYVYSQPAAPARPQFEVASIKVNKDCGSRRGGSGPPNPGRMSILCWTAADMIQAAYVRWGSGPTPQPNLKILGGPDWAESELYDVEAKADGDAPPDQMYGPMMQTLLEARFHLKVHRETKELPVYALTVAKGGLKVAPIAEGSCEVFDVNHLPVPKPGDPARPFNFCGRQKPGTNAGNLTLDIFGTTMRQFSEGPLSSRLDRPVIDRTGVTGRFDFHLEFSPVQSSGDVAPEAAGPSIFTAVQEQLGLKLESTKGPVRVVVVDHIERPSEN